MKIFWTISFCIFILTFNGQNDTLSFENDFPVNPGPFKKFYKSGKIKIEGYYDKIDSIECINCFDRDANKKVTKAKPALMRTGIWKEYFESGQLKETGIYKGIHETYSISWPKDYHNGKNGFFVPGGYSQEYLKDKTWKYYNEKGELIKEEYFYNGDVADVQYYEN